MLACATDWIDQWQRQCRRTNAKSCGYVLRDFGAHVVRQPVFIFLIASSRASIPSLLAPIWSIDLDDRRKWVSHGGSSAACVARRDASSQRCDGHCVLGSVQHGMDEMVHHVHASKLWCVARSSSSSSSSDGRIISPPLCAREFVFQSRDGGDVAVCVFAFRRRDGMVGSQSILLAGMW